MTISFSRPYWSILKSNIKGTFRYNDDMKKLIMYSILSVILGFMVFFGLKAYTQAKLYEESTTIHGDVKYDVLQC
jgi:hypothetical protein